MQKLRLICWSWIAIATMALPVTAQERLPTAGAWPDLFHQRLASYSGALRLANGRVDIDATLARLKQLGATTYYWLIDYASTDWDDLKLFLPKAAEAGVEVWVYILPPRESPPSPFGGTFSEPFRLDYARWAQEIAQLSLKHPNLTAWVIDDFYLDDVFFSPAYVRSFQLKAKAINPRLAFLPLMYPQEIQRANIEPYRDAIDGIVVAYLADRGDIDRVGSVLGDVDLPGRDEINFPDDTPSQSGDFGMISQTAQVAAGKPAIVNFRERDNYTGATTGYHFKQLLVDGQVAWEADVAGGSRDWHEVVVDISKAVKRKTSVTLAFRLFDKQPVGNFGVKWQVADLTADGLRLEADLSKPQSWRVAVQGSFETGFGAAAAMSHPRPRLPFISMVATQKQEFQLRHGAPATPQRIADQLRVSLRAWQEKKCDGVVTYCLDMGPQSDTFSVVQALFHQFGK